MNLDDFQQPVPLPRHRALPIGLVTRDRNLLIVGGGIDTVPRTRHAAKFDWKGVRVLLPAANPDVDDVAAKDARFAVELRKVTEDDIRWAHVVVKDSGLHGSGEEIAAWCRTHGRLLNCVDAPDLCDLYYMSLVFRGPLILGITSGGHAPALSAVLRRRLEAELGRGWLMAACLMAELRSRLPGGHARMDLLKQLARREDLLVCMENNDEAGIRKIFNDAVAGL